MQPTPEMVKAADEAFEKALRDDFETRCVELMQSKRETGKTIPGDNGCEVTREALCWRLPSGEYGIAQIASAWQGYCWAVSFVLEMQP